MASGFRCDPNATGSAAAPSRRNRARIPDSRYRTSDSGWTWMRSWLWVKQCPLTKIHQQVPGLVTIDVFG